MTKRTDTCPRCQEPIRPGLVGCKTCWYALPEDIRKAVNANFVPKQTALTITPEYRAALYDALDWFKANPVEAS
jgi:hypothetical protein